ncbi:spore cortex-lytic enzyme [Rossellomorea vietnamensis]|uniref:spore cortex-lytic enzyme n=2 Tax=Bacillaceae TaxID=186817 RepID=UPI003D299674
MVLMCSLLMISSEGEKADAFTNQVIQHGATGEDVIELQSRLQYIGYYNGDIDGVFGWGTYWALRNFQYEFGLPIDGLAGAKTKEKLVKASKYNKEYVKNQIEKGNDFSHYGGTDLDKQKGSTGGGGAKAPAQNKPAPSKPTAVNTPNGFSQNDIQLIANAVYGESRGEPYEGQVAVAAVILNRIDSSAFPNTVAGVIFEPGAFTAVADGQIWLTPNERAKEAVLDAINGWDPSSSALYYFNPVTATSKWIWSRPQIKKIGKHIFCS